jgi:hypothetical protein
MANAKLWIWGILGALVTSLAFGGWAVRDYIETELASKGEVHVVQVQVQTLYDARIEQLTIQRDRIVRKPKKTDRDIQDLRDIEKELELAKKMRSIK